jgi:hypothetical protein
MLVHMNKSTWIFAVVIVVAIVVGIGAYVRYNSTPGELDSFATCLTEKGAKFYGAFWCPHCQAQKKLFGKSASKLPYIECSLPSGSGQTQVCIDQKIANYPTWEFADGERLTGEIPLSRLAEKTSCVLPG